MDDPTRAARLFAEAHADLGADDTLTATINGHKADVHAMYERLWGGFWSAETNPSEET